MKPKTRDALLTRPYERKYRVSQKLIAPDGSVVKSEEDIWKRDIADAEKAYREIPTLAILIGAAGEMDLREAKTLTAEKTLTAHLFNAYGSELIEKAGTISSESRPWKDLEDLIEGKDETDE